MEEVNAVGKTAFLVNAFRVKEAEFSKPLMCDTFSKIFFNDFSKQFLAKFEVQPICRDLLSMMGPRTAFIDARVKEATCAGATKVVILGSGLDCRALRLYDYRVTFIEVEQSAVLDFKMSKFDSYPASLVRGNYLQIDLIKELLAHVDPSENVLFIWEGNTFYIPTDSGKQLVQKIFKTFPRATIVFDTMTPELVQLKTGSPADTDMQLLWDMIAGGKNLWQGGWDVHGFASELGYKVISSFTFPELAESMRPPEDMAAIYGSMEHYESVTKRWMSHYSFNVIAAKDSRGRSGGCLPRMG